VPSAILNPACTAVKERRMILSDWNEETPSTTSLVVEIPKTA